MILADQCDTSTSVLVLVGNGSSEGLKKSMIDQKKTKNSYRPHKDNRTLPCGCVEAETVDARSGYYVWTTASPCDFHKVNNEQ